MRKKRSSIPPLPPLSFEALDRVQKVERYATAALSGCSNVFGVLNNPEKALRILRSCVVEVFEAQIAYYSTMPDYQVEWAHEIAQSTINTAIRLMPVYTSGEEFRPELNRTLQMHFAQRQKTSKPSRQDRRNLRDAYLANFPNEQIKILDICWAAGQHYREWKRWLKNELKEGSTPDLAFRRILTSGKRPQEFNSRPRPSKWQ